MVHMIAYDLKKPNDTAENYELIISAIKTNFSRWCHVEKSTWLVEANINSAGVRDLLKQSLHPGDVLFVAPLKGGWASWNFGEKRNQWLKGREFGG
jgi:hypothetical protein